ncbi:unnamed protein product [Adineta ricciae]|uniref:Uncharacterized protein n=1 Tax=Adineta ricciae TaxID=249248 RepID=A0A814K806_ADIRI|nr:unnamed protein product [Adineta ricciae]
MISFLLIFLTYINHLKSDQYIPFFVMKPNTIINQTLHSYCKEQYEFRNRPMYINLTEWPSGFIYGHNPYETNDFDYNTVYEECTIELRASLTDQIRLVFDPFEKNLSDDYDQDYMISLPKLPCLRIRDNEEIITYDCYTSSLSVKSYQFNEYISSTNIIYLELIQPPILTLNDYDDNHLNPYELKFFFTKLSRKTNHGLCLDEYLIDFKNQMVDQFILSHFLICYI